MQGRTRILALAALLCVPALGATEAGAQERRAQPRSSSSSDRRSGGSGSSAAGRHAQPRSSAPRHNPSAGSARHQAPSSRHVQPRVPSGAQARHPRPGTGTGYRYRPGYGGGYYPGYRPPYYPWYGPWNPWRGYYSPWYPSLGFGLGYGYGYGYGYPSYPYYPTAPAVYVAYQEPDAGSVRVQVQPRSTRVYVDGRLAGVADDFDGMGQALVLAPGRHELTLEQDGYRTHRVLVYVTAGVQLKIRHDMERGAGGPSLEDLTEGRGEDEPPPEVARRTPPDERDDRYTRREPVEGKAPGVLRLRVTPADASIYADGAFQGSGETATELALAPGKHRIEVVRPGYDPWVREVEVEAGERRELVVALPPR